MDTIINSLIIVGCVMAFNTGIKTKWGKAILVLLPLPKPVGCNPCLSFWVGAVVFGFTLNIAYLGLPFLFVKVLDKYIWS